MKRKELFWMLVPCLALFGAGFYYSHRANGSLRLITDEAVIAATSPREVAEGWDTKVRVKYHLTGIFPLDTGSLNRSFPIECQFIAPKTGKVWDEKSIKGLCRIVSTTTFEDSLLPKLSKSSESALILLNSRLLPVSAAPLELVITLKGELWNSPPGKSYLENYQGGHKITPPTILRFTLRPRPADLQKPLSKAQPFKLVGYQNSWFNSGKTQFPTLEVVVQPYERQPDEEGRFYMHLKNIRWIIDGYEMEGSPNEVESFYSGVAPATTGVDARLSQDWVSRTTGLKPMKNITVKADLSVGNCWPQPIEVKIRENGKNIERGPIVLP